MLILTYVDYEKNLMFAFISSAVFMTRKSVIGMKTMYKFIKYYEHALGIQLNATNAWIFHLSKQFQNHCTLRFCLQQPLPIGNGVSRS
jgi:hypothetical protein